MKQYTGTGYTIYKHTNRINGKCYIGQTKREDLTRRWTGGHGYKGCTYIANAIKKYGWNNFTHEILVTGLSKEEADCLEREFIALYRSNEPRFGYNIRSGGHHAGELSEEGKRKFSIRFSGENSPVAKGVAVFNLNGEKEAEFPTLTDAAKYIGCGVATLSRHCTQRTGTAMNHICRYKSDVGDNNFLTGEDIYKPNEQRRHCKRIVQYTLNGEFIKTFNSIKEAASETGTARSEVIACAREKALSANGFLWRYEDSAEDKIDKYKYINGQRGIGGYSARAVYQYDRQTGEKLAMYVSLTEAANAVNAKLANIHQAVNSEHKTCKGYYWRYADDNIEKIAV